MARPLLVCLTLASISLAASQDRSDSIMGFSAADAARQRALESKFLVLPSAEKAREWHREFTREPHPAASAENNRLADFVAAQWRAQGWENVTLRRYEVLHSAPRSVSLEMVEPSSYRATLRKTAGLDAISKLQRDSLNRALLQVESNFLDPAGIPGRPWFKHVLYGARYTYAHLEFPGLTEAVERDDWPVAAAQRDIIATALAKNAVLLRQAAKDLNKP